MTVSYSNIVGTCRGFGNFHRLLRRWRASIYKLVLPDLILFLILRLLVACVYHFYIESSTVSKSVHGIKSFKAFVNYCAVYQKTIPVSFILGFYLANVVSKWWRVFQMIPWPDTMAILVSMNLLGADERSRLMRRTIMRYLSLSFVLTMRMCSIQAKRRFPKENYLVEAGFLLPHEHVILRRLKNKCAYCLHFMVPLAWSGNLLARARREGRWPDDITMNKAILELDQIRGGLHGIIMADWLTIPLMYTQVATLALYLYFLAALFGSQHEGREGLLDILLPLFNLSEFFFYMGLLKVAETMVNPWGEDDDDWDVNWFIDRHLQVSYLIVDKMHCASPALTKDAYWDHKGAIELPYTDFSLHNPVDPYHPSAAARPELLIQSQHYIEHGVAVRLEAKSSLVHGQMARRTGGSRPSMYAPPLMTDPRLKSKGALKLEEKYKLKHSK